MFIILGTHAGRYMWMFCCMGRKEREGKAELF